MNILRKLAWTAVFATTVPASTVAPSGGAGTESAHAGPAAGPAQPSRPAASGAGTAKSAPAAPAKGASAGDWPGWPWPLSEADEIEDEFEGEGWSFWGR